MSIIQIDSIGSIPDSFKPQSDNSTLAFATDQAKKTLCNERRKLEGAHYGRL